MRWAGRGGLRPGRNGSQWEGRMGGAIGQASAWVGERGSGTRWGGWTGKGEVGQGESNVCPGEQAGGGNLLLLLGWIRTFGHTHTCTHPHAHAHVRDPHYDSLHRWCTR